MPPLTRPANSATLHHVSSVIQTDRNTYRKQATRSKKKRRLDHDDSRPAAAAGSNAHEQISNASSSTKYRGKAEPHLPPQTASFLGLPHEIRDMIYKAILGANLCITHRSTSNHTEVWPIISMFMLSRRIKDEFSLVFYQEATYVLTFSDSKSSNLLRQYKLSRTRGLRMNAKMIESRTWLFQISKFRRIILKHAGLSHYDTECLDVAAGFLLSTVSRPQCVGFDFWDWFYFVDSVSYYGQLLNIGMTDIIAWVKKSDCFILQPYTDSVRICCETYGHAGWTSKMISWLEQKYAEHNQLLLGPGETIKARGSSPPLL